MLVFAISFLIGVSQLLWLPTVKLFWLIPSFIILGTSMFFRFKLNKHSNIITLFIAVSLGFSYAITVACYAKEHQLKNIPSEYINVVGKIVNLPVFSDMGNRGNKIKFSFNIHSVETDYTINKVLVSWYNSQETIETGQVWKFKLKLKPIHGYRNPGSFDYSKWLFRHGYDATATVKSAQILETHSVIDLKSEIHKQRLNVAHLINENFKSTRIQGLIQALTIGDKSQISYQDSKLFQDTGTSHLIAISGLHIGLIAFIGVLFGRLVFIVFASEKLNRFKYEALFAITFAFLYALLAGLSIPTIRALVMVVVFSLSYAFKFNITRWQAWSFAMLIVLLIDPFSVLDVGFWFSFGAVAVLMFAFTGRKNTKSKTIAFIKAQIVILIGLMPLMALVFQQINLLTPIANLLVLPLASLLLIPLLFASLLVYTISVNMADFLFGLVEKLSIYMFNILDYLQQFSFLTIPIHNINIITIFALIFLMSILLLPRLFRWRILSVFLIVPLFSDEGNDIQDGEFQVNILDVGQGLSVIIQTNKHNLIYDTGAKYESGFSLASTVVIPYLQHQGIKTMDKMILSHADNDHAGGVDEILKQFNNINILDVMGDYASCQYPNKWYWDGVQFEILSPFELLPYLGNNSSCVIKISSQYGSILLTGDIEEPVEYRLFKNLSHEIQSDVLLIPHHGSKTSSSLAFIKQVDPNIAINSSGYANQFNHPHPTIKKQYLKNNIKFYDTQNKGMIELSFLSNGINVQQYSDINHHFWQVD